MNYASATCSRPGLKYSECPRESFIGQFELTRSELHHSIDGGVRRASDVLKAVALGAKAVGIGRPFLCKLEDPLNGTGYC